VIPIRDQTGDVPAPISVALDVSAVPEKPAGAGRYVIELARALSLRDDVSLTLVGQRGRQDRWETTAAKARLLAVVPQSRPARLAYERLALGRALSRLEAPAVEVHHSPHYTMPAPGPFARVVTVHDATFIEHPEWHEGVKAPFFAQAIRRASRHADVIVCVSQATARALGRLLDVRAEVIVAEHGVDHERFHPGTPDARLLAPQLRDGELIVHLGTLEPRKGLVDLVRAFDMLASTRQRARLVLAGTPGWGAAEVRRATEAAKHCDRIDMLGFVDDDTVVALLRAAAVVAYPSREEGFGLPALEALATGALLVTTEGTAMAEVAGEAAWLVAPGSPGALFEALSSVLDASHDEIDRRRRIGLERARSFSWERSAEIHVGAYRLALERRRATGD
jgi:glycosyltransferase involved in cell wall biosynthesis